MTVYEHVTITGPRDRNWIVDAQEDSVDPSCSGFVSSAEGLAEESGDLVLGTLVSPFPCSSGSECGLHCMDSFTLFCHSTHEEEHWAGQLADGS